jgi:hypothetical protein
MLEDWIRRYFFRKAVRNWCLDIRLHRELSKKIRELQKDAQENDNHLMVKFICLQLDLFVPDYRRLDNLLMQERIKRLSKKLKKSRQQITKLGKPQ